MNNIVTIRASALSDFLDCPARAEAKHLRGLRTPNSGAAQLGTAIHASTALFDKSALDGQGLTVDETAAAAVDAIYKPEYDVVWDDDYQPKDAEKTAVALHSRYCAEIAPTQNYAAVEAKCERLEITDIGLALTGTTDRISKIGDGFGVRDLKTGKTAVRADGHVKTDGHRYQIGVYELLAERASGLPITEPAQIIGMQTGKTERAQRIAVSDGISGARDVLIGEEDSPGVLEMVAKMVHAGTFFGNPRSMLCGEKFCPIHAQCKFRK
jgi:PD-(D/E)XK nuclease superfamily